MENKFDVFGILEITEEKNCTDGVISTKLINALAREGIDYLDIPFSLYMDCNSVEDVLYNIGCYNEAIRLQDEQRLTREAELNKEMEEREAELTANPWVIDVELTKDEVYIEELFKNGEYEELKEFALELVDRLKYRKEQSDLVDTSEQVDPIDSVDLIDTISKKEFNVTIPSHENIIKNSKVNYTFLSILARESIRDNIKNKKSNTRILPKKYNGISIVDIISRKYHMHIKTVRASIQALIDVKQLEDKGDYYKLNLKTNNKYFVEIHSTALEKIYNFKQDNTELSDNKKKRIDTDIMIRLLTYLSWKLKKGSRSDLSIEYICKAIGLTKDDGTVTKGHTDKLSYNIQALNSIGVIKVFCEASNDRGYKKNNTYYLVDM